MPWKVVERKIGRAGGVKQRTARQREWDQKYGEGDWAVGSWLPFGYFTLRDRNRPGPPPDPTQAAGARPPMSEPLP